MLSRLLALALSLPLSLPLSLVACRSAPAGWEPGSDAQDHGLPPLAEREFQNALIHLRGGRSGPARVTLERLVREYPDNLPVAIWLQELWIEIGATGPSGEQVARQLPGQVPPLDVTPAQRLRRFTRDRAERDPSARNLVLAARLEDDLPAAMVLLERALVADPECAWAHYGKAYVSARRGDWDTVRESLARALQISPSLMRARRLEAWMLARSGSVSAAVRAWERWLTAAVDDPSVSFGSIRAARLDLAQLAILGGDPERARELLEFAEGTQSKDARHWLLLAAAEEALDHPKAALHAAAQAELCDPEALLPSVQQALLQDVWLENPEEARVHWERVLTRSLEGQDLGALLQRMRARLRLEQLSARERAQNAGPENQGGER